MRTISILWVAAILIAGTIFFSACGGTTATETTETETVVEETVETPVVEEAAPAVTETETDASAAATDTVSAQ